MISNVFSTTTSEYNKHVNILLIYIHYYLVVNNYVNSIILMNQQIL